MRAPTVIKATLWPCYANTGQPILQYLLASTESTTSVAVPNSLSRCQQGISSVGPQLPLSFGSQPLVIDRERGWRQV